MGSYLVDTSTSSSGIPFTVIFTQDMPLNGGIAAIHCSLEYATDKFEAAANCIAGLGGYGSVVVVLDGHHIPILIGDIVHVWDNRIKYRTFELPITNELPITKIVNERNPAKLIPKKPRKKRNTPKGK